MKNIFGSRNTARGKRVNGTLPNNTPNRLRAGGLLESRKRGKGKDGQRWTR